MKIISTIIVTAMISSSAFATDYSCFKFQKNSESGIVRIQVIPNNPELSAKLIALNEDVADKLTTLTEKGTLCLKGSSTPAGFLAYDLYQE